MTKREENEIDFSKIAEIDKDELLRESDRGCVLILASDVENQLEDILRAWFDRSSDLTQKEYKNLFDFTGPLGNFSSKIYICKAIGAIGQSLHSDLHKIRAIRNEAAHSKDSFSLSDDKVKQIISSMDHNFSKSRSIARYSPSDQAGLKSECNVDNHESVMKARGYLRFDKVNFIFTVRNMQIKLGFIGNSAGAMGDSIKVIRNSYETLFSDFILRNVSS